MHVSVTRLKNLGILTTDGSVVGFTLAKPECVAVIQKLRAVLFNMTADEYLRTHSFTPIFPECIVYQIIRDNKAKLI